MGALEQTLHTTTFLDHFTENKAITQKILAVAKIARLLDATYSC